MAFPPERTSLNAEEQRVRFMYSPLKAAVDSVLRWVETGNLSTSIQHLQDLMAEIDSGKRDFLGYPMRERD